MFSASMPALIASEFFVCVQAQAGSIVSIVAEESRREDEMELRRVIIIRLTRVDINVHFLYIYPLSYFPVHP